MQALLLLIARLSPAWFVFFASLALSLVAIYGAVTVNKDGAFYIDIAYQASEYGFSLAQERFNWPWFILLLAGSSKYLGLPVELAAYLWCSLFMAGTCALLVDVVRRRMPEAVWWACLVVLAMPAFNQFRGDILREFGFWFFSILTLWLALRWQATGSWSRALALFPALLGAVLFRFEAVVLLPALLLWQLPMLFNAEHRSRALQLYLLLMLLAVLGGLGLALLIVLFDFPVSRLVYYAELVSPLRLLESFDVFAEQFGNTMAYKYSRDEAGQIILFGLLAVLLIMFFKLLGPFSLLFLCRAIWYRLPLALRKFDLFGWVAILYVLILLMFFIQQQFINSRYLSFLNLLVVPSVAVLLAFFAERCPRLGKLMMALALLVMVANVVSLSAKKTHYIEAGSWVREYLPVQAHIYYSDGRIAYYADRGYPGNMDLQAALAAPEQFDYLLIEADGDEAWLLEWLEDYELRVLNRFANRKDDAVLVIGK